MWVNPPYGIICGTFSWTFITVSSTSVLAGPLWGWEINQHRAQRAVVIGSSMCGPPLNPLESRKNPRIPLGVVLGLKPRHTCTRSFPLSETHSSWVFKTFKCKLFYVGDNPRAYLPGKDIFCGQLGDESQRGNNGNKVKWGGGQKMQYRDPAHFQVAVSRTVSWRLSVCSSRWLFLDPPGREGWVSLLPRPLHLGPRAPSAEKKSVTCV